MKDGLDCGWLNNDNDVSKLDGRLTAVGQGIWKVGGKRAGGWAEVRCKLYEWRLGGSSVQNGWGNGRRLSGGRLYGWRMGGWMDRGPLGAEAAA